ncbi:MAG: glycosyltransferase [Microgenomates group bacterium]|nr:glycosyltransferase [Microgenomates group bacterium]
MIKVSILCLTYNHEKYIKQALDSFLMQKTNFDFEVLIHDDASTDKTPQIIKQYQKKYPNIIKPIFSKYNKYSKGIRDLAIKYLLPKAKGKYIAVCDGDDYWIDKNKLQLQVNYLDKNKNCSIVFHAVKWVFENKEEPDRIFPKCLNLKEYNFQNLLKGNYIQPCSVMYRKENFINIPRIDFALVDWFVNLYHASKGKIGYIDKIMSVYRKHKNGQWWNAYKNLRMHIKKYGLEMIKMFYNLYKLYGQDKNNKNIIFSHINYVVNNFIEIDEKQKTNFFERFVIKYPKIAIELSKTNQKILIKLLEINKYNNISKLLIFSHSSQFGGSERSLLELIDELLEMGVLIMVILPSDGPLKKLLDERPVVTEIINYCWWARVKNTPDEIKINENSNSFSSLLDALPKIKLFNPDIVYTNTVSIPWGALTSILINKPHIWHIREFGKSDHNLYFDLEEKETKKFINAASNYVITNSKAVADFYSDFINKNKIITAYNYISIPQSLLKEKPTIEVYKNKKNIKLLILGTIMPSKGQLDAVVATNLLLKKKYNIELAIVGAIADKNYYQKISEFIEKNKLKEKIHISEFVNNPYPIINLADIVLNCSVNEAFGRTTVEAMLLKKAVIATKSGGTTELIKNNQNGLLYKSGNFKELAEKIEYLINNKHKIRELGKNAYKFVKIYITKKNYGGKIYKILKMAKKQRPIFEKFNLLTKAFNKSFENKIQKLQFQLNSLNSQNLQLTQQLQQQQAYIQNLEAQLKTINSLIAQNIQLKTQIQETKIKINNLESQLNIIKSAKFFKLWQGYCNVIKLLKLKKE